MAALSEGDAEFLLTRAASGELRIRVGQIWRIPNRRGQSVLQCDYDNCKKISKKTIRKRLEKAGVETLEIIQKASPGGNGLHVLVWVRGRFHRWQTIALQSILESDPEREAQNFKRAQQANKGWQENWRALFQKRSK